MEGVPCTAEEFARYDCLVLSTPHMEFTEAGLYAGVRLVVDTRHAVPAIPGTRIVLA
jgi:hypothetical protein